MEKYTIHEVQYKLKSKVNKGTIGESAQLDDWFQILFQKQNIF